MCQHLKVVYRNTDGKHHCEECNAEFFHLDLTPGKLTVMELSATLRDQFAMAAMGAMLSAPQRLPREVEPQKVATLIAESCYIMADSMLEARKK
jgi:hypothetical protein